MLLCDENNFATSCRCSWLLLLSLDQKEEPLALLLERRISLKGSESRVPWAWQGACPTPWHGTGCPRKASRPKCPRQARRPPDSWGGGKKVSLGGGLHHLLSDGNTEEAWQQILQVALFGDEVLSSQTIVKEHLDFGLSKDFKNLKWASNWGNETSLGGHNTLTAFNRSQKQIL